MKKYIISGIVVLVIGVFIVYEVVMSHSSAASVANSSGNSAAPTTENSVTTVTQTTTTSTTTTPTEPATTPATTASSGQYKDGTYTSPVEDAVYGKLQIAVTISGGRITDVTFPEFPNSPGHTTQVSNATLPQLKSEAIAAQSANVDIVSGATQDSQAFQQALIAVLSQAQA